MNESDIKKIVIVGGGTAGWMAAALLARLLRPQVDIVLVESDAIGTVGVGEATLTLFSIFNSLLGINEADFMRATQATFKLGIKFENWGGLGESYFHPFGKNGDQFGTAAFYSYWLRARSMGHDFPFNNYSLCAVAAKKGRFFKPEKIARGSVWSTLTYAYHLDAGLYAKFLRDYATKLGVVRKEGLVAQVLQHENGFVRSVYMADGSEIGGDFFIDCTGFKGLLIEDTLATGYEDWSHWLICDRAIAVPCQNVSPPLPYTRSIAHSCGWQWKIPLQSRTGNGLVYSSSHASDDQALDLLLKNLDSTPLKEPNFLKFKAGRRKKVWNKNVLSLGLSSGFIEPLESTSIHLIQSGLMRFVNWFPSLSFDQRLIDEFNSVYSREVERIRDFVILHYHATRRNDSEFWRYCRNMPIPPELKDRIETFCRTGRLLGFSGDFFKDDNWLAVFFGQGVIPRCYDPIANLYSESQLLDVMKRMPQVIEEAANSMPPQKDFIEKYCAFNAVDFLKQPII